MTEKLKVSREVADAIEYIKTLNSIEDILANHSIDDDVWVREAKVVNDLSLTELATALIVGYEVRMTPHEVIKADYENALKHRNTTHNDYKERFFDGYLEGVENTLAALNIKIKGVNDK